MTAVSTLTAPTTRLLGVPGVRTGLVGSGLLFVGAWGNGALRRRLDEPDPLADVPVLGWLRDTSAGDSVSTVVFFAGILAVLLGWLALGRHLASHDTPLPVVWRVGALWGAPLLVVPPLASRDVYSYLAQGHLAAGGIDPYSHGPATLPGGLIDAVSSTWRYTPSPYGPGWTAVAELVSTVSGGRLVLGVLLMRLLAVAGVVALALVVRALAPRLGVDPVRATWLAVLNPLVLVHLVGGIHNDAVMLPLLAGAVLLALRRHPVMGAVLVGLAMSIKVTTGVVLPFLAVLWVLSRPPAERRSFVVPAFAAVGATGVSVLAGLSAATYGFGWLEAIGASTDKGSRLSLTATLRAASEAGGRLVGAPDAGAAVGAVFPVLGLLVAAAMVLWLLRPGASPRRVVARCGAAALLVALLGPILHPWYLLAGLMLIALSGPGRRATEVAVWTTVVASVLTRPGGGEVLYSYLPLALSCAAVVLLVVVRAERDVAGAVTHP